MYKKSQFWLGLVISMTLAFSSCKKDEVTDPVIPNEQEIITTLNMTMTPSAGGSDIVLSYQDIDGDGPDDPVVTISDSLDSNTSYIVSLLLLNETVTPADTINAEILEEAEEHQFFFLIDGLDASISYADTDADGNPVGLSSTMNTGAASDGSISVILRHEPDKTAAGVVDGDISNAGGETDIEVTFDVDIQ